MTGLVLELQRDVLNEKIEVSNLLRKAVLISIKLGVSDIANWLQQEINGYSNGNEIPEYRNVRGNVKVHNPYHGLIPFMMRDTELLDQLSCLPVGQSVSELEDLVKKNTTNYLTLSYSPEISMSMMQIMEVPMQPYLKISISQLSSILDSLRNKILIWTTELEKKSIKGEGMSFSTEEKKAAESISYQITNNIANMQNSQLQQASSNSTQSQVLTVSNNDILRFVHYLKSSISDLNLSNDDKAELEAEITTVESQLESPKPKNLIISECFKSVRNIPEGITGSLVATGLLAQLNAIISNI